MLLVDKNQDLFLQHIILGKPQFTKAHRRKFDVGVGAGYYRGWCLDQQQ